MRNNHKKFQKNSLVDMEYLERCISLTPAQRFKEMEELNEFVLNAMPEKNKEIWKEMKKRGW